jgi:hypothetical protein
MRTRFWALLGLLLLVPVLLLAGCAAAGYYQAPRPDTIGLTSPDTIGPTRPDTGVNIQPLAKFRLATTTITESTSIGSPAPIGGPTSVPKPEGSGDTRHHGKNQVLSKNVMRNPFWTILGLLLLVSVVFLVSCATESSYQAPETEYPSATKVPPSYYDYNSQYEQWFTGPYWRPDIGP